MAATKRDGLYKRGRFWWVRTDPVTGESRSTKCTDLEAARRWRTARERQAADPSRAAAEKALFGDWTERFLRLKQRTRSKATLEFYQQRLAHFVRLWGEDCRLATIEPVKADEYSKQRRADGVTDRTIGFEFTALRGVLAMAKRGGCFAGDIATIRPPDLAATYVPRKRALTRPEVVALLSELKPHYAALVAVCIALGCRLSEAYRLLPSDVDMLRGQVLIRGSKTAGAHRWVPVLSVYRSLLEQALPHLPLQANRQNLHRIINNAAARAKIAHCSPNDFRRTHATLLAEAGVDRDVTRRLLGHTTTRLVDTVYGQPRTEALGALAEERLALAAPVLALQVRDTTAEPVTDPAESEPSVVDDYRMRGSSLGAAIARGPHKARQPAQLGSTAESRSELAGDTNTRHSPQAWALAYAADRVLGGGR